MAQHARFNLVYDGPALEEHTMDVRSLAPALLAMGDIVERANEILNGVQAKVSVNVKATFRSGSFGIDMELAQSLWQKALDFAGSQPVVDIVAIGKLVGVCYLPVKGYRSVMSFVKWLRGRPIRKIEPLQNGSVKIYVDDESIEIEEKVLALVRDYKIRKALEALIEKPLSEPGIDTMAIADGKATKIVFEVEKSEARFFTAPPAMDEQIASDEYEANLQVLTLAFADGNKWRFTEGGGSSFYATMADVDFAEQVATNREVFAKDDVIKARIRRIQKLTAEGLKAEYEIIKVIEHRSASPKVQLTLDVSPPTDTPRRRKP